jgi:hypothetical protein
MTRMTTGFRVEFDEANRISLMRVEGRLTDESLPYLYEASRKYSSASNARVSIVDLSSVSEFAVSSQSIQNLAHQKPASKHCCFIVAPEGLAFGLCRMFQILGEVTRPLLHIVHTLVEVFEAIGIRSPHFVEPSIGPVLSALNKAGTIMAEQVAAR